MKIWPPDEVLYRPTMGFVTPVSGWFRGALSGAAEALVTKSRLLDTGWFEQQSLEKAVRDHKSGLSDNGRLIWQLVMLDKALERLF
jgi:asparagine synthase (glutamine-hydrolysing)